MNNRLIYVGLSPGTLSPSVPMWELHQGGRFMCALQVETTLRDPGNGRPPHTVTVVRYAWTHGYGGFGSIVLDRVYGTDKRSQRRAITRALLACPAGGGTVLVGRIQ